MQVVIIQRHEVIRRGLSDLARRLECIDQLISTPTVADALEELGEPAAPDVIVIDDASAAGGRDAVVRFFEGEPRLLMLVTGNEPVTLAAAARCAADGYLMLASLDAVLLEDALERVRFGALPLPPELADYLLGQARAANAPSAYPPLTPREAEVVELLARGLSNKQIAVRLQISIHGVKRHVSNILTKMICPNRAQAVAKALHAGIVSLDGDAASNGASHTGETLAWAN